MSKAHFGTCRWTPQSEFQSHTPYGPVDIFGESGQRAVELMLLSAAACLNFFLVEYAKTRNLPITDMAVTCTGEIAQSPVRVSRINTDIKITGDLGEKEIRKMVTICERACKIMNTLKATPDIQVSVEHHAAQVGAPSEPGIGVSGGST